MIEDVMCFGRALTADEIKVFVKPIVRPRQVNYITISDINEMQDYMRKVVDQFTFNRKMKERPELEFKPERVK